MTKVVARENESTDELIMRFKSAVKRDNIIEDMKSREAYVKPGDAKRAKHKAAEAERNRKVRKANKK